MKKISTLIATAAIALVSMNQSVAQTNNGSACGCPTVASRTPVNMSTLAVNGGAADGDLVANTILTCDKLWILDKKIYVPNGLTLTIQPGTVIKATATATAATAASLVVSRGGKIYADGTADCQIVFTAQADPMDGTYATHNIGKWGGLMLCGQASNNLTLAANGPFNATGNGRLCVANGLGTLEGFGTSDFRNQFGVNLTTPQAGYLTNFDDNDNSGILRYVSVRYSGSILVQGGEINGITFGSVGRGTIVDHVEVISNADDNMEFFGGTVNVKNSTFMFGNDDMFDWDLGYSGKAQNIFSVSWGSNDTAFTSTSGTSTIASAADNGFEMDADDQQSGNGSGVAIGTIASGGYRSHPVIYNCTMIGTNKRVENSDNTGMSAICAKELTEGEIYNCVFANFSSGLNLWTGNNPQQGVRTATLSSAGASVTDSYDNWRNNNAPNTLIIKNNTFIGMGTGVAGALPSATNPGGAYLVKNVTRSSGSGAYSLNVAAHAVSTNDTTQFFQTDGNVRTSSIPGFNGVWAMDGTTNTVSTQYGAVPNPVLATSIVAPADGFFTPENYRGAFGSGSSWLSGWAYATLLQTTGGLAPCPTDINHDGITNNQDFLILLGNFNQSCP